MLTTRPIPYALTLCALAFGFATQVTRAQEQPVVEIVHTSVGGIGFYKTTIRLYGDRRYTSDTDGADTGASGKLKKFKLCEETQLEPEEFRKVLSLAEQPAFQNAAAEYTHIVIDYPDYFTITYRDKGREKIVRVANFRRSSEAERSRVPLSVVELLKWADPTYFNYLSK